MTSAIDVTKPVYANPTTQSVRDNFSFAHNEITDLQNRTFGAPFLPITGGIMNGPITMQNDPANPLEVATKRYIDNLVFGPSGGVPDAPADGMAYARGSGVGGLTWIKTPLFQSVHIGSDSANDRFNLSSDATYNQLYADATNNFLRFNRTTNTFELVANNVVMQTWSATVTAITGLQAINQATIAGASPTLHLTSPTVGNEYIYFETGTNKRWAVGADSGATGFAIYGYDVAGAVIGKAFNIAPTTLAITLGPLTHQSVFDAKGNLGIGTVPPIGQSFPIVANGGGWSFQWGMTASNWAQNAYFDGSNWRYLNDGYSLNMSMGSGIFSLNSALSGTKDSVVTFKTNLQLNASNDKFVIFGGNDPLNITVPTGNYARTIYTVSSVRAWSAGIYPDGRFIITDETSARTILVLDTAGTASFTGAITAAGIIQTNTSLLCNGSAGQFGPGGSGMILQFSPGWYWNWTAANGTLSWLSPGGTLFTIDPGGNGSVYGSFYANGNLSCNGSGVQFNNIGANGFNFRWGGDSNIYGRVDNAIELPISNYASDERLKQDIAISTHNCLATIVAVPLYEYRWRDHSTPGIIAITDESKPLIPVGLVSQRLQEIFPAAVTPGTETSDHAGAIRYAGIETNIMLALLCGAVQQLNTRLLALEERV